MNNNEKTDFDENYSAQKKRLGCGVRQAFPKAHKHFVLLLSLVIDYSFEFWKQGFKLDCASTTLIIRGMFIATSGVEKCL